MAEDLVTSRRLREALPVFTALASLLLTLLIAATLQVGRDIFIPIALAILLSFVLAPLVRLLQRARLPRGAAVLSGVLAAAVGLALLGAVIAGQVAQLAADLPQYRTNIQGKVRSVQGAAATTGALGRAVDMLQDLGQELQAPGAEPTRLGGAAAERRPVPVEVREPDAGPLKTLGRVLSPLVHPLATVGLVLIFAIFMLVQREDLRNRFIRLAGTDSLQRTTAAIDDAAVRLSRLFLTQLCLNAGFGLVIGLGLWAIGVPSPVLWGVLAAVLRFVPYIGAVISAALPLGLAFAVDPGWSMVVWTAALFLVIEPLVGHAIEPLVYGQSTGLSPVAVILAATFWTFLWGPIGLVLATPLTVCLVVLGRYVDRLRFLDVLLGDRPALSPPQIFYQRMLAGDPAEAVEQAREFLKQRALATYYDEVALEGVRLAQDDMMRGSLLPDQQAALRRSMGQLVDSLARVRDPRPSRRTPVGAEAAAAVEASGPDRAVTALVRQPADLHPDWRGPVPVLCVAGQGVLDEAVARMLGQLFERHGLKCRVVGPEVIASNDPLPFDGAGVALVCFSYLDALSTVHIRFAARRLRRKLPERPKVVVGLWRQRDPATVDTLRRATSADVLVTSLHDALAAALAMSREPARERSVAEAG